MALENSDDIKISSRKVGKAVSDRQAAKTAYFPKISGSATYAYIFENIDMGMVGMEMSMKGMYMAGIYPPQAVLPCNSLYMQEGKLSTQTKWQKPA